MRPAFAQQLCNVADVHGGRHGISLKIRAQNNYKKPNILFSLKRSCAAKFLRSVKRGIGEDDQARVDYGIKEPVGSALILVSNWFLRARYSAVL
jgi:hypothetical protein